jgi:hypothetical protein
VRLKLVNYPQEAKWPQGKELENIVKESPKPNK